MTEPYYADDRVTLYHGDCLRVMAELPGASVDAVITDPPYGQEFSADFAKTYAGGNPNIKPRTAAISDRGSSWQPGSVHGYRQKNPRCRNCGKLTRGNGCCKCPTPQIDTRTAESANVFQFWCEEWAREAWRLLKPGGHLLSFGSTRTYNRLASGVEDAGFELRDCIAWLYNTGFPKPFNLKPAFEPIVVARKPPIGSTAANIAAHGTGGVLVNSAQIGARWPCNVATDSHVSETFQVFKLLPKADAVQRPTANGISHPTVKPLDLMRWLVRLVTPPNGVVLDPFAGSGTTAEACIHEHMRCITIEREADYLPIIVARLSKPMAVGFDFEEGA